MFSLIKKLFVPTVVGFLLTIITTWPLILKLATFYPDLGDYSLVGWMLWYNFYALKTGRIFSQTDYFNSTQFYPFPNSLAFSEHMFIPSLLFTPFYALTNNLALSVNIFVFLSFLLSFIAAYFFIKYFLKDELASIIGATVYAFNPITLVQFHGHHLHLLSRFFLPLVFLCGFIFFKKPNLKSAFLFSLVFTINALTSIHFFAYSIIGLFIFALPFVIINFKNILKYTWVILIFIPLLLHFNYPYYKFSSMENIQRQIGDNVYFSARLLDWVSTVPNNFLYGPLVQKLNLLRTPKDSEGNINITEHSIFLNIIPPLLFIIGIVYLFKLRKKIPDKNYVIAYAAFFALTILSALFTFGPYYLGVNNNSSDIKLPYKLLYDYVPIFKGLRVPTRIQFLFYVPFSLFVGFGAYYIFKYLKGLRLILFTFILFLIILENFIVYPFDETSKVLPQISQNAGLKNILKGKKTIHLPISTFHQFYETKYLAWSTQTEEFIYNGYSGYTPPDWGSNNEEFNKLEPEALKKMKALGLELVVIHKSDFERVPQIDEGVIYSDANILVLDLDKMNWHLQICDRDKDIELVGNFKTFYIKTIDEDLYQLFPKLKIKNNADCYLSSPFQQRYSTVDIYLRGKIENARFNFPILITPYYDNEVYLLSP